MKHALRQVGIEPRTSGYQALRSANCTTSPISKKIPRVYLFTGGAGARWAGPDELFLGYRFLRKSVFAPVLPRPQNGPGSSRQAKTWSNRPSTRIVPDESVCAEIGHLFLVRWSTKDGPLSQSTICPHIAGKDTGLLQISTYYRIPTVIKAVLWLIANR